MRMKEFVDKYCADIKALYSDTRSLLKEDYDLPFDDEIEDDSGQMVKVVYAGTTAIPILDIITCEKSEFARLYPDFECRELYEQYISGLIMLDGEEAVHRIRNSIQRERDKIDVFKHKNSLADQLC